MAGESKPILLDVPERIETERMILRPPRAGDGAMHFSAVTESFQELKHWMPWAKDDYTEADSEEWCRKASAEFILRQHLAYLVLSRNGGKYLGTISAMKFAWDLPSCEVGYWLRTQYVGRGLMTEALNGLCGTLLGSLKIERIEIRTDDRNQRSWSVAERCGFVLEGTLRNDCRDTAGQLRNTRIYAKIVPG